MLDPTGGPISGAKNWSSGYMPASYQGVILRSAGQPILDLARRPGVSDAMQRRMLETLGQYNAPEILQQLRDHAIAFTIGETEKKTLELPLSAPPVY